MKPSENAIAKSWMELHNVHKKADTTLLELIAHPEATDAMVLEACHARRENIIKFRETYRKTLEACQKKGWRRAEWIIMERRI